MLLKVEEVWMKNSLFMTKRYVSGICILKMIYEFAWVTLMDMLVSILMGLMQCMEDMV